ncbi:hypothetical protein RFI_08882 [Reticulomyxa filosa]|uniref:Uncharacterized protein n=1 Tax=Reticulomyxa filosa TaxID=46433 RepID=X6NQQ8_RETFI|nr:hypothetical protein RFI_08882 [Reticulomyxa filosa]|eukprot:ETO28253.1 hypothetical protein RFI_08882 [Reticulomyxa filosa]
MDVKRAERKKWMKLFEGTDAVLWVMSLASYDQKLFEDNNKNRYEENFELLNLDFIFFFFVKKKKKSEPLEEKKLKLIASENSVEKKNVLVFLNKVDILREKLDNPNVKPEFPFSKFDSTFDENLKADSKNVIEHVQKRHEEIFGTKKDKKTGIYCLEIFCCFLSFYFMFDVNLYFICVYAQTSPCNVRN